MKTPPRKRARFAIGQVVFVDDLGFFGHIKSQENGPNWWYEVRTTPSNDSTLWPESQLRALTQREIGPRRKGKGR